MILFKGRGPWMSTYNHNTATESTPLYARFSRAVTNHAPIGSFRQRFNLKSDHPHTCPGHPDVLEDRHHILNECSWYARRLDYDYELIEDVILFLMDNPHAFSFTRMTCPRKESPDWPNYVSSAYSLRNLRRSMIGLDPIFRPIFIDEKFSPTLADLRVPRVITRVTSLHPYTVTVALESYFEAMDNLHIIPNRSGGGNPHA